MDTVGFPELFQWRGVKEKAKIERTPNLLTVDTSLP